MSEKYFLVKGKSSIITYSDLIAGVNGNPIFCAHPIVKILSSVVKNENVDCDKHIGDLYTCLFVKNEESLVEKVRDSETVFNMKDGSQIHVQSLLKNIKPTKGTRTWGFGYDPYSLEGLQIILNAILDLECIIYVKEKKPQEISDLIWDYKANYLCGPKSFLNFAKDQKRPRFRKILHIFMQEADSTEEEKSWMSKVFPKAKIHYENIW